MEYQGEVVRRSVADVRERHGRADGIYFFALAQGGMVVDATHAGGIARFINHSCRQILGHATKQPSHFTVLLSHVVQGSMLS